MTQIVRGSWPEPGPLHILGERVKSLRWEYRGARQVNTRRLRYPAKPPALAYSTQNSKAIGRLGRHLQKGLAESGGILVEPLDGLFEILLPVFHVVPLPEFVFVRWIDLPVHQRKEAFPAQLDGVVRYAEVDQGFDSLRVLHRDGRCHPSAPVMANPDRCATAGVGQQSHHTLDEGLLTVVFDHAAGGRFAVPRHIRGNDTEAQSGEDVDLNLPGDSSARPAMNEQDQRAIDGASRQIIDFLVASINDMVFCDGSHHCIEHLSGRVKNSSAVSGTMSTIVPSCAKLPATPIRSNFSLLALLDVGTFFPVQVEQHLPKNSAASGQTASDFQQIARLLVYFAAPNARVSVSNRQRYCPRGMEHCTKSMTNRSSYTIPSQLKLIFRQTSAGDQSAMRCAR